MTACDRDRANALMGDLAEVMHYTAWRKMRDSIAQALADARVEVLHGQALREENRVRCSVCEGDPLGFVCLRCDPTVSTSPAPYGDLRTRIAYWLCDNVWLRPDVKAGSPIPRDPEWAEFADRLIAEVLRPHYLDGGPA